MLRNRISLHAAVANAYQTFRGQTTEVRLSPEDRQRVLQVLLLGQPQLRYTLARPDLDQLRQRVAVQAADECRKVIVSADPFFLSRRTNSWRWRPITQCRRSTLIAPSSRPVG